MDESLRHEHCWAKTKDDGSPGINVRDHCLNVGCVTEALLALLPSKLQETIPLGAATLAASHDVGKVSPGFQVKSLTSVTGDYFSTLGVQPLLGWLIVPDDVDLDRGSAAVAVLDYRCWKQRYGGDPAVVGKTISIEDRLLTIIGVTLKNFAGLIIEGTDVTVPAGYSGRRALREPANLWLDVVGRLKPGLTLEQARVQLETIWPSIQDVTAPEEYQGSSGTEDCKAQPCRRPSCLIRFPASAIEPSWSELQWIRV